MSNTVVTLEDITKHLPDTVIVVDEQVRIVAANKQVTGLFGYGVQELIGQKLSTLLPPQYRAKHDQHFREYLANPSVRMMGVGLQLYGLRKDGSEMDIDVALSPVEVKGRRLVVATIRDVTEKRDLERSLRRKNEQLETINVELERFGYMIAHDLKSPLINIHALIHLIKKELPQEKSERLDEYILAVQNSLEAMTSMISGVSAYTKAGTTDKVEEAVDLNKIMEEVTHLIRVPKGGSLEVTGPLPTIIGNKTKVLQVFMNLICNAFKYNDKEAARVEVQASVNGNSCQISVADNGPGVPTELRRRIFRLFDKGNSLRKDSQGIGLSIVKKIVEERGGRIAVGESAMGGAAFSFTWPFGTSAREISAVDLHMAACPAHNKSLTK